MITVEQVKAAHFNSDLVHLDGRDWHADRRGVKEFPRLQIMDKQWRRERRQQRIYVVDGTAPYETIEEAVAALNMPAALTGPETEFLERISGSALVNSFDAGDRSMLRSLVDKGFLEWGGSAGNRTVRKRQS